MTRKTYCGNLLWQSGLTLLVPNDWGMMHLARAYSRAVKEALSD